MTPNPPCPPKPWRRRMNRMGEAVSCGSAYRSHLSYPSYRAGAARRVLRHREEPRRERGWSRRPVSGSLGEGGCTGTCLPKPWRRRIREGLTTEHAEHSETAHREEGRQGGSQETQETEGTASSPRRHKDTKKAQRNKARSSAALPVPLTTLPRTNGRSAARPRIARIGTDQETDTKRVEPQTCPPKPKPRRMNAGKRR
jgi:hypothetical protein